MIRRTTMLPLRDAHAWSRQAAGGRCSAMSRSRISSAGEASPSGMSAGTSSPHRSGSTSLAASGVRSTHQPSVPACHRRYSTSSRGQCACVGWLRARCARHRCWAWSSRKSRDQAVDARPSAAPQIRCARRGQQSREHELEQVTAAEIVIAFNQENQWTRHRFDTRTLKAVADAVPFGCASRETTEVSRIDVPSQECWSSASRRHRSTVATISSGVVGFRSTHAALMRSSGASVPVTTMMGSR